MVHRQTGNRVRHDAEDNCGGRCDNPSSSLFLPLCFGLIFGLGRGGIVGRDVTIFGVGGSIVSIGGVNVPEFAFVSEFAFSKLVEPAVSFRFATLVVALLGRSRGGTTIG